MRTRPVKLQDTDDQAVKSDLKALTTHVSPSTTLVSFVISILFFSNLNLQFVLPLKVVPIFYAVVAFVCLFGTLVLAMHLHYAGIIRVFFLCLHSR